MNKTVYEKDAIDLFNKYYIDNNKDITKTLIKMEVDGAIPYFFMDYYGSYVEFLAKFNIPRSLYLELKCTLWIDKNIKKQNKVIKDSMVSRDIINSKDKKTNNRS